MKLKLGFLAAFAVLGSSSFAGFEVISVLGDLSDGSGNLSAGTFSQSGFFSLAPSSGNTTASASFKTDFRSAANEFPMERSLLQFKAREESSGVADWQLPSDRAGNSSSASAGSTRIYGTWDADFNDSASSSNHSFAFGVDIGTGVGSVGVEKLNTNITNFAITSTSGSSIPQLDNSIYDLNPAVGQVLLDKHSTPILSFSATTSAISMNRPVYTFNDGETVVSPFYDYYNTAMFVSLGNSTGSSFNTATGLDTPFQSLAPGVGPGTTLNFASKTGSVTMDISGLQPGTFDLFLGTVLWNPLGTETDDLSAATGLGYYGNFTSDLQNIKVDIVPEPASIVGIGVAVAALLRRRKRS